MAGQYGENQISRYSWPKTSISILPQYCMVDNCAFTRYFFTMRLWINNHQQCGKQFQVEKINNCFPSHILTMFTCMHKMMILKQIFKLYSLKMFHNRFSEKIELVCACYYQFRQHNWISRYMISSRYDSIERQ